MAPDRRCSMYEHQRMWKSLFNHIYRSNNRDTPSVLTTSSSLKSLHMLPNRVHTHTNFNFNVKLLQMSNVYTEWQLIYWLGTLHNVANTSTTVVHLKLISNKRSLYTDMLWINEISFNQAREVLIICNISAS